MVELLVGMSMGMIVLVGLTLIDRHVLHGTARVDARVEATDNARVTVTRDHGTAPLGLRLAANRPDAEKEQRHDADLLARRPGRSSAVQPKPIKIEDHAQRHHPDRVRLREDGWNQPATWAFEPKPGHRKTSCCPTSRRPADQLDLQLRKFEKGTYSEPMSATELDRTRRRSSIRVNVALTASPRNTPVADKGSAATIKDSATLRLTPPSFNSEANAPAMPVRAKRRAWLHDDHDGDRHHPGRVAGRGRASPRSTAAPRRRARPSAVSRPTRRRWPGSTNTPTTCTRTAPTGRMHGSRAEHRKIGAEPEGLDRQPTPGPGGSGATYALELIPATDHTNCNPTSIETATASMLEAPNR